MTFYESLSNWAQSKSHKLARLCGVFGVITGWCTMYFFTDWNGFLFWLLICISTVMSVAGAWSGLAMQWGYKPFTNDPLGWRKAKQSYKAEPGEQGQAEPQNDPAPKRDES